VDSEDAKFGEIYFFVVEWDSYDEYFYVFKTKQETEDFMVGRKILSVWKGRRLKFKPVEVVKKYEIEGC